MAAFTRKFLAGLGIDEEKIDIIINQHLDVLNPIKDDLTAAKESAAKTETVQKELDELKSKVKSDYVLKTEHDKTVKAFEDYKTEIAGKETAAAKEKAVRAYFESKNITGKNLDIAIRGAKEEINALELDGESIKDATALDALVTGDFAGLVVTRTVQGAQTSTPPANTGNTKLTRADIYKRDENGRYIMSTAERQKALAENPELLR